MASEIQPEDGPGIQLAAMQPLASDAVSYDLRHNTLEPDFDLACKKESCDVFS